jgi:PncC family amidohydrolase
MDKEILDVIKRVHEVFKKRGLTLSVAESCTGGLISHYITILPGASNFFEAGVVAYSAEAKKKILGISPEVISKHGVVSEKTAKEMAEKVRSLTGTDYSLSTTGNLGPDVLEGKMKGLIYTAVSKKGRTFTKELRLKGSREENKEKAALSAIGFLVEIVEQRNFTKRNSRGKILNKHE